MKTKLPMFLASVLLITGCSKIKDAAEVTFSSQLSTSISVVVAGTKSAETTAKANPLHFSKSQVLYLKDNTEIEPYLKKIREIEMKSILVDIYGLTEGQVVTNLALDVDGVGTISTINMEITPSMAAYPPTIDQEKLVQAGKSLAKNQKITLVVQGDANGPLSFNINMMFPVDVVAGALD